jgi:hypothetical protein
MGISSLNKSAVIGATDMIPLNSQLVGGDVQVSVGTLVDFIQSMAPDSAEVVQYAAPAGSGFSAQVLAPDEGQNVFYLLTPGGAYAAGTVILPSAPWDGMRVNVHCSQAITTFSLTGGTTHGAPTTLAAGGFFTMRYDAGTSGWWRCA